MATVDATISENVNTMLHRTRTAVPEVATALGMSKQTLWRKVTGRGSPWLFVEVQALAGHFTVSVEQLSGELPDLSTWCACRDSNPKPSDP